MTFHDREPKPVLSKVTSVLTFPHSNYGANLNMTFSKNMNFICLLDQICLLYLQLAAVVTRGHWDTGTLRTVLSGDSLRRAVCSESFRLWNSLVPGTVPQGLVHRVVLLLASDRCGLQVHLHRLI